MVQIPLELRTDSLTEHENLLDAGMRQATGSANELGARTELGVTILGHITLHSLF